jgi:hypothetical protein
MERNDVFWKGGGVEWNEGSSFYLGLGALHCGT